MRKWTAPVARSFAASQTLATLIDGIGQPCFSARVLDELQPLIPAASWSAYRIGEGCDPRLYLSASRGVPDRTRDCWQAYLSGPHASDQTLIAETAGGLLLCHLEAGEIPTEHRRRVYEAHGMAERVSVVRAHPEGGLFAVNFYRHSHQAPFRDAQIAAFEAVAPALLSLANKHVEVGLPALREQTLEHWRQRLVVLGVGLTARELDVCARLLQGMTQDGIAADLGLTVPTVKTYRNRAFERLGIHFRTELFARVAGPNLIH